MVMTSNLDGASIDARRTVEVVHEAGIPILLDAAQAAPHQELDVRSLDVDFLACSGHKMLGPSGTGLLYGKRDALARLRPTLVGGGTVEDSTLQGATYREGPSASRQVCRTTPASSASATRSSTSSGSAARRSTRTSTA